jgi:hypothetical protein
MRLLGELQSQYGWLWRREKPLDSLQLSSFGTLSIILFFYLKQRFGDWILSPFSGKSLLRWAQMSRILTEDEGRIYLIFKTPFFK